MGRVGDTLGYLKKKKKKKRTNNGPKITILSDQKTTNHGENLESMIDSVGLISDD